MAIGENSCGERDREIGGRERERERERGRTQSRPTLVALLN